MESVWEDFWWGFLWVWNPLGLGGTTRPLASIGIWFIVFCCSRQNDNEKHCLGCYNMLECMTLAMISMRIHYYSDWCINDW